MKEKKINADRLRARLNNGYYTLAWMNAIAYTDGLIGTMYETGVEAKDTEPAERYAEYAAAYISGEMTNQELAEALLTFRVSLLERVEALSALAGELSLYEYICKRIVGVEEADPESDDEEIARELLHAIFESEDPMVTNLRIQYMVSCLPVRMTKSRFYDLLAQNLSLYGESDTVALQGFCYRIRSAAAMGEGKRIDAYEELYRVLDEMKALALSQLTEKDAKDCMERLELAGDSVRAEMELLENVTYAVNNLTVICMLKEHEDIADEGRDVEERLAPLLPLLLKELGREADAGTYDEEMADAFSALEGSMENSSELLVSGEASLQQLRESNAEWAAKEECELLVRISKLMSTSVYAELTEEESVPVTEEILRNETKALLEDFARSLEGRHRSYVRAVMAAVLGELPVFFNSREEVMNYVLQALGNCRSKNEKLAAVAEVKELYEERQW